MLNDTSLRITYEQLTTISNDDGTVETVRQDVTDDEDSSSGIELFESFYLYGGAFNDNFSVDSFTKNAVLDGTEGGDSYTITLSGDLSGASRTRIVDSGQSTTDTDSIILQGSEADDTIQLDVEDSTTDYTLELAADTATLQYDGTISRST